MADVSVPDGSHYGDLGINFRKYTDTLLTRHIHPKMAEIEARFEDMVCARRDGTRSTAGAFRIPERN